MVQSAESRESVEMDNMVGRMKKWSVGVAVGMSMLLVQVFTAGLQLLSKVILAKGTFIFALIAYRNLVAALSVAPFAFFVDRGFSKKLTWSVCFGLFVNALTGATLAMSLFYYGLRDTSATYAINFLNLIPILTFLFSTLARIEKLGLGSWAGKLKTLGAIMCVAGAMTAGLYKGRSLDISQHNHHPPITLKISKAHWPRGTIMLVGSSFSYSAWFLVQAKLLKAFPFKYSVTMLTCIIASVQSAVVGLCLDTHKAAWSLGWNLQLITIIYSGAVSSAAAFCLVSWAIAKRGPTYPSMFNPIALILVAISEALIFGEEIRVGILVGAVLIIVGLYSFLWGKRKELLNLKAASEEVNNGG